MVFPGLLFLCLVAGCMQRQVKRVEPAFYYWKTNFRIDPYERSLLEKTGTRILYTRFFDVDWKDGDTEPKPVGVLRVDTLYPDLQYIPVVYITQRTLSKMNEAQPPVWAERMATLISKLCTHYGIGPQEIQIDCDWTKGSRRKYFDLLRHLKQHPFFRDKLLSCTIRLHQVKYKWDSGIPPVDKGLLMVYNMGNLTRYGGHNSILSLNEAKNYLQSVDHYPLTLDMALPLYHWAVVFEAKRFKGILYNLVKEDFPTSSLSQVQENLYRVSETLRIKGAELRVGQEVRFERTTMNQLLSLADFLGKKITAESCRLGFFHLDSSALVPYTSDQINKILDRIRN